MDGVPVFTLVKASVDIRTCRRRLRLNVILCHKHCKLRLFLDANVLSGAWLSQVKFVSILVQRSYAITTHLWMNEVVNVRNLSPLPLVHLRCVLHITNAIIPYHLLFVHDPQASSVHIQMLGIKSGAQLDPIPFPLMEPFYMCYIGC